MMRRRTKKAIALYETRIAPSYIIKTVISWFFATILFFVTCAILPFAADINIGAETAKTVSFENLTATRTESERPDSEKERVQFIPTSEAAFIKRLNFVASARHTIDFSVFDNYDDLWTRHFYAALLDAADRGVRVRIVVDGKMGKLDGNNVELGKILQNHNNIEFYYFNPLNIANPSAIMVNLHDKITIADGKRMIVGGVNMGRGAYLSNYDAEVMVTNSGENGSVGQAMRYFESLLGSGNVKLKRTKYKNDGAKSGYIARYKAFINSHDEAKTDISEPGIAADKVTFLSNRPTLVKKEPVIMQALYNLAENSSKTLIVTPYALLEDGKIAHWRSIAAASDEFTIVTNSLYNSRNVAYSVYHGWRSDYICDDIALWEYQAVDQLHAKMYLFDDRYTVIGSFNFDERSAHIDTESVVLIDSYEFNALVREYINNTFLANSLRVGANNKYIPSDTVKAGAVPPKKSALYTLMRCLKTVMCLL